MGDSRGALNDALAAQALAPDRAEPCWFLGTLRVEPRQLGEGERALRKAIELDPRQARFHQNLAALCLETGRAREAVTEARTAVALAPEYPEGRYTLGLALARDGRKAEAAGVLRALVEDLPDSAVAQRAGAVLDELAAGEAP